MTFVINGHLDESRLSLKDARPGTSARGLGSADAEKVGTFSRTQNRAILIVAVIAASLSLLIAMISLRWFLSMERSFRHQLILLLILSDSFKALWLFVSPFVGFSCGNCGQLESSSPFSQASGFMLATGIEAADLSILFIALHTTLYVFRPPERLGDGGLYKYRYGVYALWVALPLLAASLAFTNPSGHAYVTSGTFSYLPKRSFWYRLALAWIPRYIIIFSIIAMYTAIYIYIKVKFRGFETSQSGDFSLDPSSMQTSIFGQASHDARPASLQDTLNSDIANPDRYARKPSASSNCKSPVEVAGGRRQSLIPDDIPEWEKIESITTPPPASRQRISHPSLHLTADDYTPQTSSRPNDHSADPLSLIPTDSDTIIAAPRKPSNALTSTTNFTTSTALTATTLRPDPSSNHSPNDLTRALIRHQLRLLFLYPLIYLLVWLLPLVQHCLAYTDRYTAQPLFWLNLCATAVLALQAGVDCLVFSWRERPWRREDSVGLDVV